MKKILIYIFTCIFLTTNTYWAISQTNKPDPSNYTKLIDVLSPSPNAASLGRYGDISLNLSSGSLNLSVPLYNYKSINLELPISLSYSSNNIRVNEIAPSTGMSWALNVGGSNYQNSLWHAR